MQTSFVWLYSLTVSSPFVICWIFLNLALSPLPAPVGLFIHSFYGTRNTLQNAL